MLNPFTWLRRQAAEAVVLGTADGLRAVAPEGEQPDTITELRAMLSAAAQPKQLTAAKDEEEEQPSKGKRSK